MTGEQPERERQISGDDIIAEVLRNADASQFSMRRTVLLPSIFHIYLHPGDLDLIRPVIPALQAEARSALMERVAELNRRSQPPKIVKFLGFDKEDASRFRILDPDYTIEFYPDAEDTLARGDIEVRSELASAPRPEFDGAMTRHVTRRQTPEAPSADFEATVAVPRVAAEGEKVYGWLRYSFEGAEQSFPITKDEIAIGRGGKTVWVDLRLTAPADVSREHCRIRRDSSGKLYLKDLSQFGTFLDGRQLPSGTGSAEVPLPSRATISLANVVTLTFESSEAM